MKLTTEDFKERVKNLTGNEYKVLGNYTNSQTPIKMKHMKCGYEWMANPNSFSQGRRCPKCSGHFKRTDKEFKEEIFNLVGDEYTFLDKFKDTKTKMRILHKKCGKEFLMTPTHFIHSNNRCPHCIKNATKNTELFYEEVRNSTNGEYELKSEYINSQTPVKILHYKCGNIYKVRPYNFSNGHRCPKCRSSKGENKIIEILENLNIKYKREVYFKDCKNKFPLRFDFQLILENNSNIILLEYDGIFHFKTQYYQESYENQKIRDNIKNEYCKKNNIHLYRIKYTEFNNIENIINEIIKKEGSTTIESII